MSAADIQNMQTLLLIYALCSAWSLYNCGKKKNQQKAPKKRKVVFLEFQRVMYSLKKIPQLLTATLTGTVHFHCISCKKINPRTFFNRSSYES